MDKIYRCGRMLQPWKHAGVLQMVKVLAAEYYSHRKDPKGPEAARFTLAFN